MWRRGSKTEQVGETGALLLHLGRPEITDSFFFLSCRVVVCLCIGNRSDKTCQQWILFADTYISYLYYLLPSGN